MVLSQGSDSGPGGCQFGQGKNRPVANCAAGNRATRSQAAELPCNYHQAISSRAVGSQISCRIWEIAQQSCWSNAPGAKVRCQILGGHSPRDNANGAAAQSGKCNVKSPSAQQRPETAATSTQSHLRNLFGISAGKEECKSYFCPFPVLASTLKHSAKRISMAFARHP
jgi:hypothetical protein